MDDQTANIVSLQHGYAVYPLGDATRTLTFWRRAVLAWWDIRRMIRARGSE